MFCVIDVEKEIYSDAHIIIMGAIALNSQRSAKSFAYYYRLGLQSAYSFQWESFMFTDEA